eukprot:993222_1
MSFVVNGLKSGQSYEFRVKAENKIGWGGFSTPMSGTPATFPGAPTITGIIPGNSQIILKFSAPAENGGRAVSKYRLKIDGAEKQLLDTTGMSFVVTGLTNGQSYKFQVNAQNEMGWGKFSTAMTETPATVPGKPTIDSTTAANSKIIVNFTEPTETGGRAVSNYLLKIDDEEKQSLTPNGMSFVVDGLQNGQSYKFRVKAWNGIGWGEFSDAMTETLLEEKKKPVKENIVEVANELAEKKKRVEDAKKQ